MTTIREAKPTDFDLLVNACEQLHVSGNYYQQTTFKPDDARQVLQQLSDNDANILYVAEDQPSQQIMGMLGLGIIPHIANFSTKMAHEYFWWVNEEKRNLGVGSALLKAGKAWASHKGCDLLLMQVATTADQAVHEALQRQGFSALETNYQCSL